MNKPSARRIAVGMGALLIVMAQACVTPTVGHCPHCGIVSRIGRYQADIEAEVQLIQDGLKDTPDVGHCAHCLREIERLVEMLYRNLSDLEAIYREAGDKSGLMICDKMRADIRGVNKSVGLLSEANDQRAQQVALRSISISLDSLNSHQKEAETLADSRL